MYNTSSSTKKFTAAKNNLFTPDLNKLQNQGESISINLKLEKLNNKELKELEELEELDYLHKERYQKCGYGYLYIYLNRFNTEGFLITGYLSIIEDFFKNLEQLFRLANSKQTNILNTMKNKLLNNLNNKKILDCDSYIISDSLKSQDSRTININLRYKYNSLSEIEPRLVTCFEALLDVANNPNSQYIRPINNLIDHM
jgi:hypothetical protein